MLIVTDRCLRINCTFQMHSDIRYRNTHSSSHTIQPENNMDPTHHISSHQTKNRTVPD